VNVVHELWSVDGPASIEGGPFTKHRSSLAIDSTLRCHANAEVPFNATITVTNLDNSRSVQCVSSIGGRTPASCAGQPQPMGA